MQYTQHKRLACTLKIDHVRTIIEMIMNFPKKFHELVYMNFTKVSIVVYPSTIDLGGEYYCGIIIV